MRKIVWFARGGGIEKYGPFDTQIEAVDAMRLVSGGFPDDVFVWPEFEDRARVVAATRFRRGFHGKRR